MSAMSPNDHNGAMSPNTDFAAVIGEAVAYSTIGMSGNYHTTDEAQDVAVTALAAPIPSHCPDCKGTGHHWIGTHENDAPQRCDHPNAPTIGQALTEWEQATADLPDGVTLAGAVRIANAVMAYTPSRVKIEHLGRFNYDDGVQHTWNAVMAALKALAVDK
jgi:hypothetical protein